MKAKLKVIEKPLKFQEDDPSNPLGPGGWWKHPYVACDLPDKLPVISREEIGQYLNAKLACRVTRIDFELKRALILKKLIAFGHVEYSDYEAKIDDDGGLVVTKKCGCCNHVALAE